MKYIATSFLVILVFGFFVLAIDSITSYLNHTELRHCYDLKYLHVSGTEQEMTMTLTEYEHRRLHEDIFEGVPVLSVNAINHTVRKSDIRVIGATGIIYLTPCQ